MKKILSLPIVVFLSLSCLAFGQSTTENTENTPFECPEPYAVAVKAETTEQDSGELTYEEYAFVLCDAIWLDEVSKQDGTSVKVVAKTIYACWEALSQDIDDTYEQEKLWVKEAIETTWQKYSALTFKGWKTCADENRGIRILIDDSGPRVSGLGALAEYIDASGARVGRKNYMKLNFTFNNWGQQCKLKESDREDCIKIIAVHEFGHALGFAHEQNRPDVEGECGKRRQGTDGDIPLTPYDIESVMNYCNKKWANEGVLSELDIEGLQTIYGNPSNE